MKLYHSFLSLAVTIVMSSSFAQPDIALANKLTRPVYYSIGKAGSAIETALNKPMESLDPAVGAVAKTLSYDIGRAGTEILLSSKPGEAELFRFTPGKTIYVDIKEDKAKNVLVTPQSGTATSLWRKTDRGYPLSNNVTQKDIMRTSLNSNDIPATNPQAFLTIYGPRKSFYGTQPQDYTLEKAEPRIILSIPIGTTANKDIVNEAIYNLLQKWHPNFNKTPGAEAVSKLILEAASTFIPELKQTITQ